MGLLNSSCSFTRFRVIDPITDEIYAAVPDKLKLYSFRDIDEQPDMQSIGWVNFDEMLDPTWAASPPHKGELILFSMRMDTRRIPPAVLKKHLAIALQKEKKDLLAKDRNFIPRERKKEIREQVALRLRQRFLPVPAVFDVVWIIARNEIWFFSVQSKMIDLFMEEFLKTFNLHIEPLTPYNLAASFLDEESNPALDGIQATMFAQ